MLETVYALLLERVVWAACLAMAISVWHSIQRRAPQVVLALVVVMGLLGVAAFYFALRPCVLELQAGRIVHYRLTTTILPEDRLDQRVLREEIQDVRLIQLGADGEGALLVQPHWARRGELRPVSMRRAGQVLLRDGDLTLDYGPAVGYFDFNLLRLPPGLDQAWDAEVRYGYPPPDKRAHNVRIRRTHNGSRPRFRWQLPAIEWVDRAPPGMGMADGQRYVQMQDVTVTYRFDTQRGIWQDAQMQFSAGVETAEGYVRHRIAIELVMLTVEGVASAEQGDLRSAVSQLQQVQGMVARQQIEHIGDVIEPIRRSSLPFLAALAQGWYADMRAEPTAGAAAIQVATLGQERSAQSLRWQIVGDGYPAVVRRQGRHWVVYAGPFAQRDELVLADVRRRFLANKPFWTVIP